MTKKDIHTAAIAFGAVIASAAMAGIAYAALQMPVIGQRGKAFSISEMNVRPDSTIRISNDDDVVHVVRVTAPDGTRQDAVMQKPGDSTDITVDKLGEYMVRCNIHPTMKLVVRVR